MSRLPRRFVDFWLAPARSVAVVRVLVVLAIYVADRAEKPVEIREESFDVLMAVAVVWALGLAVGAVFGGRRRVAPLETLVDLIITAGLVWASGGPFSDARRAFFIFPVLAAATTTPKRTALVGTGALFAFTTASFAEGLGRFAGTTASTLTGDLYLVLIVMVSVLSSVLLDVQKRGALGEAERNRLLSRQLLDVQDRERQELAQWLHDDPVQLLVASKMELAAVRAGSPRAYERLSERIEAAEISLRGTAFDLSPYALEELGLCGAIREVAERECERTGMELSMHCDALAATPHDRALFAVARELISNAARHARALSLGITIAQEENGVAMIVADDGIGLDRETRIDALRQGHLGLVSARERAATIGHELQVERPLGGGTSVSVRPIRTPPTPD